MEVRKADSKGRVYLGSEFAGMDLYVVRLFDAVLITHDRRKAEELEKQKEEYVKGEIVRLLDVLGEPSVEEIKEVLERSKRRRLSSIQT
mgnify:FL=1